jgi:hypothetical protein
VSLPIILALASLALALVAGALAWLAFEVRLIRCGKIHPRVLSAIETGSDRFDTYRLDHRIGDTPELGTFVSRPDYA